MLEKIAEFFVVLLFLPATPGSLAGIYGALFGLFSVIVFVAVYVVSWRVSRMRLLGRWARLAARWMLRIQAILFAMLGATIIYPIGHDQGWGTPWLVVSVATVLVLPPAVQEVLIRRLGIRDASARDQETPSPALSIRGQRTSVFLKVVAAALRNVSTCLRHLLVEITVV